MFLKNLILLLMLLTYISFYKKAMVRRNPEGEKKKYLLLTILKEKAVAP
jgi:hypothetical protein